MQSPKTNPPEVVAQFRYTVIAPIVVRKLAYGEQRALIQQQTSQDWTWPDGACRRVHPRTVLRWVAAYRAGGLEALQPGHRADRSGRRVPAAILDRAVALRAEDPHRSARHIIQMLEWAGEIDRGTLKHSTLTYHFRQRAAAAYVAAPPADTFRRRQAPHYNAEWLSWIRSMAAGCSHGDAGDGRWVRPHHRLGVGPRGSAWGGCSGQTLSRSFGPRARGRRRPEPVRAGRARTPGGAGLRWRGR